MPLQSKIDYVDYNWPLVAGCRVRSPGCANCWAAPQTHRLAANPNPLIGPPNSGVTKLMPGGRPVWNGEVRTRPDLLDAPVLWDKAHAKKPYNPETAKRVFVCPRADLFAEKVPDTFLNAAWNKMAYYQHLTFLVLTKEAERLGRYLREAQPNPLPNVWVGVSVESAEYAYRMDYHLADAPAAVRWVSLEPLLGPIPLRTIRCPCPCTVCRGEGYLPTKLDWVVVGAESGPRRRPMNEDWVRQIRDECLKEGIAFLYKQRIGTGGRKEHLPELDGKRHTALPGGGSLI